MVSSHHTEPWASLGMGRGGAIAPWKCCNVFCALAATVNRSVGQLFMHYFHNFLRVGVVQLIVLACQLAF